MNMETEDFLSQGLTAEVVGMLILNELKCFRRELTDEVKNLSKRIDKITEHYFQNGCNSSEVPNKKKNSTHTYQTSLTSQSINTVNNYNSKVSTQLPSDSFKEFFPDNDNEIVNNHIAFRMTQPLPKENLPANNEDQVLKIANICGNALLEEPLHDELEFSRQTFNNTLTFHSVHPSPSKATVVGKSKTKEKYTVIYKCTFCTDYFNSQLLYNQHFSDVHGDTAASMSSKSFWDDQTSKNCFELSQPKLIYICSVCSREFSTRGSLLRHSVLHSGVKKYVCKLCGKGFFRSDHLKSHLPTHSRKKQYQCSLCFKYFSRSQNFKNHLKLHDSMPLMLDHGTPISVGATSRLHEHSQASSSYDFTPQHIDLTSTMALENNVSIKEEVDQ